jgi:Zn-dependent peptidase ImmA (M78 family)
MLNSGAQDRFWGKEAGRDAEERKRNEQYYEELKRIARQIREEHGISSPRVMKTDVRRIYKTYGIRIDLWPYKLRGLRGAYFNDEHGATVMIARSLPQDPLIFTMGHELKHHLVDRHAGPSFCDSANQNEEVEIGAEVFAAELIFPDGDYVAWMTAQKIKKWQCRPEDLVRMKRESKTTLSYAGLVKKAEFLECAKPSALSGVKWKKLEVQMYGEPLYKTLLRRKLSAQ